MSPHGSKAGTAVTGSGSCSLGWQAAQRRPTASMAGGVEGHSSAISRVGPPPPPPTPPPARPGGPRGPVVADQGYAAVASLGVVAGDAMPVKDRLDVAGKVHDLGGVGDGLDLAGLSGHGLKPGSGEGGGVELGAGV